MKEKYTFQMYFDFVVYPAPKLTKKITLWEKLKIWA
jgi:hypothetical protein